MSTNSVSNRGPCFLGIEGGGTRTTALLVNALGEVLCEASAGPANARLASDSELVEVFVRVSDQVSTPTAIAIGLAGVRTPRDWRRVEGLACRVWPGVPCYSTNDLETALTAGLEPWGAASPSSDPKPNPRVLVLSGTGSCCYGRLPDGRTVKVGAWGHVLGDAGSAYAVSQQALQLVTERWDKTDKLSLTGSRLMITAGVENPDDLVDWVTNASKGEVAALAVIVFERAKKGDTAARRVIQRVAETLAAQAILCARRLGVRKNQRVDFVLAGGVMLYQMAFRLRVRSLIKRAYPQAGVKPLEKPSVWGAAQLAYTHGQASKPKARRSPRGEASVQSRPNPVLLPPLESLQQSPTEQRNPKSKALSRLSLRRTIRLMLEEDAGVPPAVLKESPKIERAIRVITRSLQGGGRLFYVGAGTSGRLGVLDASECPPTFGTEPEQVQGIIAGGHQALSESVEGAEDDADAGEAALRRRQLNGRDVVVGIAASGRTPFVWGALRAAHELGAFTLLLTFNPGLRIAKAYRPDLVIAPNVGPEVLTGSTRLKAGTATKLILNLFTTLSMVRCGKVVENLMVDLNPSNAKLRQRAVWIVQELTGSDQATARQALESVNWEIKRALASVSRPRLPKHKPATGDLGLLVSE